MPYTPPSQRSPATSNSSSPNHSRAHSYNKDHPRSPASHGSRPSLPRSVSSTSYLNKHRRSPSISDHQKVDGTKAQQSGNAPDSQGTAHQSAPSKHKMLIPTGDVATPPDSSQNSDDEDRGRRVFPHLSELHQALQSIDCTRGGSPVRIEDGQTSPPEARPVRPALTADARRISHSRSTSEIALSTHNIGNIDPHDPSTSTDESDEDGLMQKPPLLRKKSGELVKPALRPTSRRRPSSMPGTPTFSKAVHFNDDIEQVRHFLQVDRPIAVSAGSSPVETYDSESEYPFGDDDRRASKIVEWDIRPVNFPRDTFERKTQPVWVERIFLSSDHKTLIGSVAVANIAFNKSVVARFTFDYWKTTSEVVAEYNNDLRRGLVNDGYDRFNFNIKLTDQAHLETRSLLLCVRYNVNGQEYWDNNNSMNFQVDFIKKIRPRAPRGSGVGGSLGAIPRSRHSPTGSRPRPAASFVDDDFGHGLDSKYRFGSSRSLMGDAGSNPIRFKSKVRQANVLPDEARSKTSPAGQAFSTRYDFGASLSAALSNAQYSLGDRSGMKMKEPSQGKSSDAPTTPASNPPSALSSEKPDLKSPEYNELIQKYCFFGSGPAAGSSKAKSPQATRVDGNREIDISSEENSANNSGSNTPLKETVSPLDGASDSRSSSSGSSTSPFLSRSASPGPFTGTDISTRIDYAPYGSMDSGFFSGSHTPTAIRG